MKKLAIVASGWHYPLHFYRKMAELKVPVEWTVHMFCVSHRKPVNDKVIPQGGIRGKLDAILYKEIATIEKIEELGWNYKEYPNTIGDWGCSNQWLEDHDYKQYDMFLFTHDDNLIIGEVLLEALKPSEWQILTNTIGQPPGALRGSFEFFKKEVLDMMGGKFDLSQTKLKRVGKTDNPDDKDELNDWNTTVYPTQRLIKEKGIRVMFFSPYYRYSAYCIEGERGLISKSHGANTALEDKGIEFYKDIINEIICKQK